MKLHDYYYFRKCYAGGYGRTKDFDFILIDAIVLWKNAIEVWYLFINLAKYLTRIAKESLEEGENFEL